MKQCPSNRQSGMVLLFCLMFLTALTLLGLSASADSILQQQLASNLQHTQKAKQAAAAALNWAEHWLIKMQGPAPETCITACAGFTVHPLGTLAPHPEFESLDWWQSHGFEAGIDPLTNERLTSIGSDSIDPQLWLIEVIHDQPSTNVNPATGKVWYRLLARGSGQTETAISVVESIVVKSWPVDSKNDGRIAWRELR